MSDIAGHTCRPQTATLLGCVADDVTGATDLALNLVQGGIRVVQWFGIPTPSELQNIEADALVVALNSRSTDAEHAVQQSLSALESLQALGCDRYYFKYCSTFDSTDQGNIGPVAAAMLHALNADQTIFCPAFPAAGRTVYCGHLFVHETLLHESGMQDHPLNPMQDSCLARILARQSGLTVGLLAYCDVSAGPDSIRRRLRALADADHPFVVTDALKDEHLRNIAVACANNKLLTGGSRLAHFLPEAYRRQGILETEPVLPELPKVGGRSAIISGSCSAATRKQVACQSKRTRGFRVDVTQLTEHPNDEFQRFLSWADEQPPTMPFLAYSTADPNAIRHRQAGHSSDQLARLIEQFHGRIAQELVNRFGVRQLVVAGGETSAAVAAAVGVRGLRIGPEIAPGVPWTETLGEPNLALAFKSGNFGDDDFFQTALEMLE